MKIFILVFAALFSSTVFAAFNFTISGRIQNPDGTQLSAPAVNFKVQVRSPNSDNCLLYEEVITVSNVTNGDFTLKIGTGARSAASVDGGLSLSSILKNDKLLNLAAATTPCVGGVTTYTPLSSDNRKVYLSFNDGSANGPQVIGTLDMNWTALAVYADRSNSTNQLQNTAVSVMAPALNQVLQFDGTNWSPTNLSSGLPSQAGNAGKVLGTDGTLASWVSALTNVLPSAQIFVGSAGNTATAVAMSGDATLSNSGALSLATSGVAAGTVGSATAVPSLTVDAKGRVTSISSQAYQDATGASKGIIQVGSNLSVATGVVSLTSAGVTGALGFTPTSAALPTANIFVGSAGGVATGVPLSGDATITSAGALSLAASGVVAGTSTKVTYDAKGRVTGGASLAATDIPALDASKITTGTLPITLGGTGAATASASLNNLLPTQTFNAGKYLQTDGTNSSWVLGNAGTVTSVSGSGPISVATGTTTPAISIATANTTTAGALSSVDWNIFNGKLGSTLTSGQIFAGSAGNVATGVALSGDATLANTGALTLANSGVTAGTYNSVTVDAKGRATAASNVANSLNANLTLSNLSGPTSIGQNLMPAAALTYDMGAFANRWNSGYFNGVNVNSFVSQGAVTVGTNLNVTNTAVAGQITIADSALTSPSGQTGSQAMIGAKGGAGSAPQYDLHLFTVNANSGFGSNKVVIETGNAVGTFNSGDIVLYTGTVATGTKGQVSVQAASLNMNSSKIVNVANPTAPQDAVTKNYLETRAANIFFSAGSGAYTTNIASINDVPGLTVTITTSGRPVFVGLVVDDPFSNPNVGLSYASGNGSYSIIIVRGTTNISAAYIKTSAVSINQPVSSVSHVDTPVAGTYTYKIQSGVFPAGVTGNITGAKLVAYEL